MLRILIKIIFSISLACAAGLFGIFYYYSQELPDYSQLANYSPPAVSRFYSSDGTLLEKYAYEHRLFTPISAIPNVLIEAFIATEDKNFYEHSGIDFLSLTKAMLENIINLTQNKRIRGGSTITQQVVKNFLLTSERAFSRKIKEAILSYKISQVFSKEKILELYLNQIYLGYRSYGVSAAALAYFNKSIEELTLSECAFLAGLPKAPETYDPQKNYAKAKIRKDYVLKRMSDEGYISKELADRAVAEEIKLNKATSANMFFADYYAEYVRSEIINKYGADELYKGGLTVITSLNKEYQTLADQALRNGLRKTDRNNGYRGPIAKITTTDWQKDIKLLAKPAGILEYEIAVVLSNKTTPKQSGPLIGLKDGTKSSLILSECKWALNSTNKDISQILKVGDVIVVEKQNDGYALRQIPVVNGAVVVMNPNTGQVLALSGGYDFSVSKFDRATQALRQPGSAIKPFVYLAALEQGIEPNVLFRDEPIELDQGPGLPKWTPKNYEENYLGDITMRAGLEKSRNLVTLRIAQTIGINKIIEVFKRFGINSNPPKFYSSVLGAIETTPLKLVNAYAQIVNGGNKISPQFIELVHNKNGKRLYTRTKDICEDCKSNLDHSFPPTVKTTDKIKLMDDDSNYQIISLLLGAVERGRAMTAKTLGKYIGGKTGTTNYSKDLWFVGFKKDLVVGVYVGYDTPKTLGKKISGSQIALPIFIDFMSKVVTKSPPIEFIPPNSIRLVNVDPDTGEILESGGIIEALKINDFNEINNNSKIDDIFSLTNNR
ncbi:MAG: penicillin-binding protein 1A [Rickettsiaceae bacterium]|nr:penicillin-binding protein 1A [Rickettsiaceae bacterium]